MGRLKPFRPTSPAELVSLAAVAAGWFLVWSWWPEIPNEVPRHFGLFGKPDAWGPKIFVCTLPAVGTLVYLLITAVSSNRVEGVNPGLPWVKAATLVWMASLEWGMIQVAVGRAEGLPPMLIVGGILALVSIQLMIVVRDRLESD